MPLSAADDRWRPALWLLLQSPGWPHIPQPFESQNPKASRQLSFTMHARKHLPIPVGTPINFPLGLLRKSFTRDFRDTLNAGIDFNPRAPGEMR